jgi:hypothetical protein
MQMRRVKNADVEGDVGDSANEVNRVQPSSSPNVDVATLHVPSESSDADHQREKVGFGILTPTHERLISGSSSNAEFIAEPLQTARQKDMQGRLPLHWAVYNANETDVTELLRAYPEGAYVEDNDGKMPLHLEIHKPNPNLEIFSQLLRANPEISFSTKATLKACLPYFVQMADLPKIVLHSFLHPMRALITISAAMTQFSREQRSHVNAFGNSRLDIRLANSAEEKANDLEQLACAIVRKCDADNFGQEMDDCLQLAAESKLKFFVSEPACSMRTDRLWTEPNPHSLDTSAGSAVQTFFQYFLLRFVFIVIFKFTHNFWMPNPLLRFLWNRGSYFIFLVLVSQLPRQVAPGDPANNIQLEIFLAYWLLDICFSEAVEFCCLMKKGSFSFFEGIAKYVDDFWNIYDIISLSFAVVAAIARGFVHAGAGIITADTSNQLHAWALALLWGRLVNILLIIPFTGPLLIMVIVMIFKDLTKFVFLVVLMELPFVVSLNFLESGDAGNDAFLTFLETAKSFFKIVIGQGPDISSVTSSSSALLSLGTVLLSVLMLNLLIAMFSKTFDTIVENSTQEYLLQKAQLTFVWMRAPRMPPPLVLFLAVRDGMMKIVSKLWLNATFKVWCVGKDISDEKPGFWVDPVEMTPPIFHKLHFFKIVFGSPNRPREKKEHLEQQVPDSECLSSVKDETEFMHLCSKKYQSWAREVLEDWEENAEFNSEAQMDRFKSRMLRGTDIASENSGKIDAMKSHLDSLSNTVQMQRLEIQQIHECMKLILQRLSAKETAA